MDACSFQQVYGKIWVSFCLNTLFLKSFIFKPTGRAQVLLKNGTRDFQNSPPFVRLACFYRAISENFEHFQCFNFEKLEYRFLVKRIKIEKASFPYKTAISEANVKTNRMVTTKWTYHKELSFASN